MTHIQHNYKLARSLARQVLQEKEGSYTEKVMDARAHEVRAIEVDIKWTLVCGYLSGTVLMEWGIDADFIYWPLATNLGTGSYSPERLTWMILEGIYRVQQVDAPWLEKMV